MEPGNWYEVDVSSIVIGDGVYSLRVSSTSDNGADYSSKESSHPLVLEITLGENATPSPESTATQTPTPTITETPTVTETATETFTPTITETLTETVTPDGTTTPEDTPAPGDTPTETYTPTASETPTETATLEDTPVPGETPTETYPPTVTETPTVTAEPTPTLTPTSAIPNGNAEYIYDGDGNMVKSVIGSVTTYYPSSSYEKRVEGATETVMKYYFAGSVRIAMLAPFGGAPQKRSDHLAALGSPQLHQRHRGRHRNPPDLAQVHGLRGNTHGFISDRLSPIRGYERQFARDRHMRGWDSTGPSLM